jgi:3-hydroxyisobutyrate dehydrogenase
VKVAFIGLGAMGLPIAGRLAEAGVADLSLFDLAEDRRALARGIGSVPDSIGAALRDSDLIITVLPADRHVEMVSLDVLAQARPGALYADLSTIAPATIDRVAGRLEQAGIQTVSIALTRGVAAARAGTLALFVGANGEVPDQLRPVLAALSNEIRYTATLGAAKALKVANNMAMCLIDIAICDALVLGERFALAADAVVAALPGHGADSWVLRNHIARNVLLGDLGPGHFSTRNMLKDVRLYQDLAIDAQVPGFLPAIAASCYRGLIAAGHAEDYHPIVVEWLRQSAATTAATAAATTTPGGAGDEGTLGVLGRGVAAIAALASLDALRVLRHYGLEPDEAVTHLATASAANQSLPGAARWLQGDHAAMDIAGLRSALHAVVELADTADYPALLPETALAAARELAHEPAREPAGDGAHPVGHVADARTS